MIVRSISLHNFQCYFGENRFDFREGLNLVIGDNGAGKSKLYDAFYWVLYDKVFDSLSREEKETKTVRGDLVSDKAKAACAPGETVKTAVEIIVFNPKKEETYTISRSYAIVKNGEGDWREQTASLQSAFFTDKFNDTRPVAATEIEPLRKKILPDDVKPYMWFQGEQVDSLIDFKKNESLTNAINVLSDISEFEFYKEVSKQALEIAERDYQRESRRVSTDGKKSDELHEQQKELKEKLERIDKDHDLASGELSKAKDGKENLFGKMENAQRIERLSGKIETLKNQMKETDERKNKLKADINKNLFSKYWLLKGSGSLVRAFEGKYDTYLTNRQSKEAEIRAKKMAQQAVQRVLLPENVPEPVYMQRMLEVEKCLVCDREAPKGTEAYQKIMELLERSLSFNQKTEPAAVAVSKHDFSQEFKRLYQNGLNLQGNINQVKSQIHDALQDINELEDKYKSQKSQYDREQKELMDLVGLANVGIAQSADVVTEFQSHINAIVKYEKELLQIENAQQKTKAEQWRIKEELHKLTKGKMPKYLEEKVEVLRDFRDIAVSTRERVFNRLILQLEEEANRHFFSMTAENKSVRGRIKLERQSNGNYMPRNLDSEGRALSSINDSNIILIKLAVIMAIISAKRSSPAAELYPLISDAPTSKFGDNYAIGFCRTASEVYSQSIIISKDFYNKPDLEARLFQEVGDRLGNVYVIEPSVSAAEQREHRNELEVRIIPKKENRI